MRAGIEKIIAFIKKYKVQFSIGVAVFIILIAVLPPRIRKIVAGPQGEYETTLVKKADIIQSVQFLPLGKLPPKNKSPLNLLLQVCWFG